MWKAKEMTKEFEEGMHAREIGLHLIDNPYDYPNKLFREKEYNDWIKGWKLEHWRILHKDKENAYRKEND